MTELNKHSASVCLISANEPEQDKLLQSIHQLEHTHTWQIYVMKESTLSAHLSDGLWSENEWEAKWQQHQKRLSHLNDRQSCPILTWLWLDEKRSLLPIDRLLLPCITVSTNVCSGKAEKSITANRRLYRPNSAQP